jgi:hypothetical protein
MKDEADFIAIGVAALQCVSAESTAISAIPSRVIRQG